jgi:hypothetical protein
MRTLSRRPDEVRAGAAAIWEDAIQGASLSVPGQRISTWSKGARGAFNRTNRHIREIKVLKHSRVLGRLPRPSSCI